MEDDELARILRLDPDLVRRFEFKRPVEIYAEDGLVLAHWQGTSFWLVRGKCRQRDNREVGAI